jgi:hypothetical protein
VALFCTAIGWSASALAQAAPATAISSPNTGTSDDLPFADPIIRPQGSIALSRLYPEPGPMRLTGEASSFDISVPLAGTVIVQEASVELHFTNSIALRSGRSVLSVRLNEATLAQIALDPARPVSVATVNLPAELWRPGYNKLTVAVTQHYTDQCEDPDAPELWTEIDLFHSRLHYKVGPHPTPYSLSDLSSIFSPGLGGQSQVLLLTAPGAATDQLRGEALPFVAQALALRRRYEPLKIESATWTEGAQGDLSYLPESAPATLLHVLVGTSDELARVLPKNEQAVVAGPNISLDNLGGGRARLVVTGRTHDEVVTAAHNLAVLQDTLTGDTKVCSRREKARASPCRSPVEASCTVIPPIPSMTSASRQRRLMAPAPIVSRCRCRCRRITTLRRMPERTSRSTLPIAPRWAPARS